MPLLPLLLAAAASAAEPSLVKNRPAAALVDEMIELRPADGHHFNPEAPQKCDGARPHEVLPRRLRCQLPRPGKAEILVSVCDDAQTFCRQERFAVDVRGTPSARVKASPQLAAPKGGHGAPEGFISNDPAAAVARAKKERTLIFVHFYGIWCPPCNQLEEQVYPDPGFRAGTASFVKLALDADSAASFDWKARFKVGGYPTLIVADADLREIGRVVGYRSGRALAAFLREMSALKDDPVEKAAGRVSGPKAAEDDRVRVAQWHADRGEYAEVESLLKGLKSPKARRVLLEARLENARRSEDNGGRKEALSALLKEFPDAPAFADWADALAGLDADAARPLTDAVRVSVQRWSSDAGAGDAGYTAGDLLYARADFLETLGSPEAKDVWPRVADAYADEAAHSPLKTPRAANFGRADALMKAGRKDEARKLYEGLVAAYPEEFTFNYEYASALKDAGEAAAAYPYAAKAAAAAYGDNWLRAVRLKGELELKLGRLADAAKTVDEALAETVPAKSPDVRTYRYLTALRALARDISQARRKS